MGYVSLKRHKHNHTFWVCFPFRKLQLWTAHVFILLFRGSFSSFYASTSFLHPGTLAGLLQSHLVEVLFAVWWVHSLSSVFVFRFSDFLSASGSELLTSSCLRTGPAPLILRSVYSRSLFFAAAFLLPRRWFFLIFSRDRLFHLCRR